MARRLIVVFTALILTFALPVSAIAGSLTLHPAGFGEKSRANWKAQQGLPDSTPSGNPNQALYFQKMVPTATVAAGVAVIKGLEGLPASQLTGLEWKHRVDGHCGAGAPRWNVNLRDASGNNHTVFLGCFAAPVHSPAGESNGFAWCRDEYPSAAIASALTGATGEDLADLTIRNLVIVFDEGTDNPIEQPPGCPVGPSQPGFVYLDDITVEINGTPHVWTSASDNGNKANAPTFGPSVAYAEETVPVSDILSLLGDAFPGVPVTSWVLYPDVEVALPAAPGLP